MSERNEWADLEPPERLATIGGDLRLLLADPETCRQWAASALLEWAYSALRHLRRFLEDESEPNVSWANPYVELHVPVTNWTPTSTPTPPTEEEATGGDRGAVSRALARGIIADLRFRVPYLLTNEIVLLEESVEVLHREDGTGTASAECLLSPGLKAELDALETDERLRAIDRLLRPFTLGARVEGDDRAFPGLAPEDLTTTVPNPADPERPVQVSLLLQFHQFMKEGERVSFPLVVGLVFHPLNLPLGEGEEPVFPDVASWSEDAHATVWEALDALLRGIPGKIRPPATEPSAPTAPEEAPLPGLETAMPVAPKRQTAVARYLHEGHTRIDKRAAEFVAHVEGLTLPRKWTSIRKWEDLANEEIGRLHDEHGDDAFVDLRSRTRDGNARGALLGRRYKADGKEEFLLTKEAEEALLATVGHKGFRRVYQDEDGLRREYLVKRFRAGTGHLEARLSWYGQAWPLVEEAKNREEGNLKALQESLRQADLFENLDEAVQKELDSRLRFMESIRDARLVMDVILHRFGRDGENPLHVPAWELRTLLECEKDEHGFRRIRGCLRALQEVRYSLDARGTGSGTSRRVFGPFLGEVSYVPRGPGEHTDGDFYLNIQPGFLGCLRVFGTSHYKIKDAHKVLAYDWRKDLSKDEKEELRGGFVKGFSALAPYYDKAKGFTHAQRRLRAWIEQNITRRKDHASSLTRATKVKPSATDADEPRLYGRSFCPLLPEGELFHGALGHFKKNPERGRTLWGTSTAPTQTGGAHSSGLLQEMGLYLHRGAARARRAETVRKALEAFRAVVEEAYGGHVLARRGTQWLSFEEAAKLQEDELTKRTAWCFFLPPDWRERRAAALEAYHAERYDRGEVPYLVKVTTDPAVAANANAARTGEHAGGDVGLVSEPLRLRLFAARKDRKLSQAAVGKLFGVSQPVVALWERGTERDENGKAGKPIPAELAPLVLRWVDTGKAPTAEELASRKTRRTGSGEKGAGS